MEKHTYIYEYIYIINYYLAITKKGIVPFVRAWMGLEGITLTKIIWRERSILHDLICEI